MTIEYDCCECHDHVVAITLDKPPEPPLCMACLVMPGWMDDPVLRGMLGKGRHICGND